MTDIADSIRKAVQRPGAEDDYETIRAEVHSALLQAHVRLTGGRAWSYAPTDVRLLDIVDRWLESKKQP
jgi:hypothetical protein